MKRYVIADLVVDMEVSGRTERQAAAYAAEADGPADITLACDVRRVLELNPQIPTWELAEYLGTGMVFAQHLLRFYGTYIHASAVVLDGKAYLFSAPSGTGKSTHTEKWCRLFGATYLNDDKPAIRPVDGQWIAYGTPWSGKHDLSEPKGYPLAGIAFVKRGEMNSIRRLPAAEAVPKVMSQSLWQLHAEIIMNRQLEVVDRLVRSVPIWELTCRNDDEAAWVSHNAMSGKETEQ